MNFWLLAFGIDYPPKIKHPSSKSNGSFHKAWTFIAKWQAFFTQITNLFLAPARVFGRPLQGGRLPTTPWDAGQHRRSSRGRGSSWRCLLSRFPNDRLKLRAHRRSQFIYDLEKIHFGQPSRAPQQKGQRTRGFGSRIVFANLVE